MKKAHKYLLKPCPFCGGEAYVSVLLDKEYVRCNHKKSCIVEPETWLSASNVSIRKQVNAWNRRSYCNEVGGDTK